jgi:hypothetical protein
LKPATERGFLRRLQGMLPPGCQPVLVTDAGFRTPWFKAVERMQWYWVARIRHRHFVQFPGQTWHSCKRLHGKASERPRCLGEALLTQTRAHRCTLVLYRGPAQGRHCFNAHGERAQRGQKYARSAREPWLLATNLPRTRALAQKVVRLYRARMQIEEAFRDLKSARFGLALGYQRTGKADRLAMLLLIAALAMMVLWLIGMVARQRNLSRHYQANTERRRGVLSVIFLAMRVIDRGGQTFTMAQLASAWRCIQDLNAACWGSES